MIKVFVFAVTSSFLLVFIGRILFPALLALGVASIVSVWGQAVQAASTTGAGLVITIVYCDGVLFGLTLGVAVTILCMTLTSLYWPNLDNDPWLGVPDY